MGKLALGDLLHYGAPLLFGLFSRLAKHTGHQLALAVGEFIFQSLPLGAQREALDASIQLILIGLNEAIFLQYSQWPIQGLLAHPQNAQQRIDADGRMTTDKVEDAVVYALQAILCQDGIRPGGEGAKGKVEQLQCFIKFMQLGSVILVSHIDLNISGGKIGQLN